MRDATPFDVPEDMLERHQKFWAMEEVEQPLLRVRPYRPPQPRRPFPLVGGIPVQDGQVVLPDLIDPQLLAEHVGQPRQLVTDDLLHAVSPYDLCWNEAIAGSGIWWRTGSPWSEPCIDTIDSLDTLLPARQDNPWLQKLLSTTRGLAQISGGRYPINQPLLRGPVDIATAVLGDEPACWAILDQPEAFRQLLDASTELFLIVAQTWHAAAPRFRGGGCLFGLWAPAPIVRTQCDNAALLSPALYRQFLVPCDERICAAFEYSVMHTHSGNLTMIAESLLELEGLSAIQVSLDYPAGPAAGELLPIFQRINSVKPLILTGGLSRPELDQILTTLSPRGLSLQVELHE